ncbi:MAG: hypothetical protein AAGA69_12125, partial [Pseudomonadota bacterium]
MRTLLCVTAASVVIGPAYSAAAPANDDAHRGPAVSLSLGSVYDTNRLRLQDGVAPPPGGSEDDLITDLTATLNLSYKTGLQRFFVEGTAGYVWHRDNTFLDNERVDLTGGVAWGLTPRCNGVLSAQVVRRQTDLADLEAVIDNTRETETYLGTAGCRIGTGWRAELEAKRTESDNSTAARRFADLEATTFGSSLRYRPNENQSFGVRLSRTELDYPNIISITAGPAPGPDARVDITVFEALASRRFGNALKVDAALGHSEAETDGGPGGFDGTTGHLEAELLPSSRLSVFSRVDRGLAYSSDVSADYFVRDRTQISLKARISELVDAEIGARRVERDFRANENLRPLVRTVDEADILRAAVHYQARKRIRVSAGIEHRDMQTDGPRG